MKYIVNSDQFDFAMTAYEFAAKYAECLEIGSRLKSAEIVPPSAKGNEIGETLVVLHFVREAHSLTLNEVAEFLDVNYVIVGKYTDGRTQVLLGIGQN